MMMNEVSLLSLSPLSLSRFFLSLFCFLHFLTRSQAGMSMEEYDKPNIRRLSITVNDQLPPIQAKK
jgi:hypothetical protein